MEKIRQLAKQVEEQRKFELLEAVRQHDLKIREAEEQKRLESLSKQAREKEAEEQRKR